MAVMDIIYQVDGQEISIEPLQQDTRKDIIEKFVACRKAKKMSQQELSARSGVQRSNIARFESGQYNPSLELLVRIAAAMDMKLDFSISELK